MARILVEHGPIETRITRFENDTLVELDIQPCDEVAFSGAILEGRVRRVVPALSAAFVDLGTGPDGFLPFGGAGAPAEGARLTLQVTRPAHGDKGPTLTRSLTLVGHRLALSTDAQEIQLSKRIGDAAERARLTTWAEGAGISFTIRARAANADVALLEAEAADLLARRDAVAGGGGDPGEDRVARLLREAAPDDEIVFDQIDDLSRARAWCRKSSPASEARLHHRTGPLLDIEAEIEAALAREVALPCGGRLIVEPTRALTAIDVDSAGADGAGARGATARRVNLEAAREIPRQLRLRAIAGLVVVDFLNPGGQKARQTVLSALEAGLARDPTPTRHAGFSRLGLVEIARTRNRPPLAERLREPGGGRASARALAAAMVRAAAREQVRGGGPLRLVAAAEVIEAISEPAAVTAHLAHRLGRPVTLLPESGLARETWRLDAGEDR